MKSKAHNGASPVRRITTIRIRPSTRWQRNYQLKGTFNVPATPQTVLNLKTKTGVPSFTVRPDVSKPIQSVDVFYTQQGQMDGPRDDRENTINRFWHHAAPTKKGDTWVAELPVFSADKPLWVYANVVYPLDRPITGAGYYYAIYTADRFNLSSLMQVATTDELKAADVRATLKPSLVIETFAGDWQKEWFTSRPESWARRTHKIYGPQWYAPGSAELALEVRSAQANLFVVGLDGYAAEVILNGGAEWQCVMLRRADLHDADGNARSHGTGLKELRLGPQETLRSKKDGAKPVSLGGDWRGAVPGFRNLRWIVVTDNN